MKMKRTFLSLVLVLLSMVVTVRSRPFLSGCRFTSWFSEEEGYPAQKLTGYPMTGLTCYGYYCDSLQLQAWEANNLNRSLIQSEVFQSSKHEIPESKHFVPVKSMPHNVFKWGCNVNSIHVWFENRSALSSDLRGRRLFLGKFVKCVEACHSVHGLWIKGLCAAEQSRHKDYEVRILLSSGKENSGILQASCNCVAGVGCDWSAACKHIAALAYHIELYGETGDSVEMVSKTSTLQTWHRPPPGRQLKPMSVNEMLKIKTATAVNDFKNGNHLINLLQNNSQLPHLNSQDC